MSISEYGDSAAMGMMQGAPGGPMGLAFGAASGIANRAMDEQAMKDQYFQQLKLNNMSLSLNKNMYDYQMNRQFEFWDKTNYKAQVEQMRKAGLNPALFYGKGGGMGATTGNASSGNFQSQAGSDTNRMDINLGRQSQIMQLSLLASQKANIDADTEKKKADAEKTKGVDTENVRANTQEIQANIDQINSLTENTKMRTKGQELTNDLLKLQILYESNTLEDRQEAIKLVNSELRSKIAKINEEIPYISKLANATIKQMEANARLSNANANNQEFLNEDYQRMLRTTKQELENNKTYRESQNIALTGQALALKNDWLNRYGISPDSGVAGIVSGMIAKFSDAKGTLLHGWQDELVRELKQLFEDFGKMQNKFSTGKLPWE